MGQLGDAAFRHGHGRNTEQVPMRSTVSRPIGGDDTMCIRVLICDEQALVRAGLRAVLAGQDEMELTGEAGDYLQAVNLARRLRAHVVVIDIALFSQAGEHATEPIALQCAGQGGVVVLAPGAHATCEQLASALRAGALGLVCKEGPTEEILGAIRAVAAGEALIGPLFTRRLLDRFASRLPPPPPSLGSLTSRQREILKLIAQGLSNEEIAALLVLEESTVKSHVSGILAKLGLRDRAQAVAVAFRAGLIPR